MMATWRKLLRLGRRFGAETGTAAVEFALILPIMLLVYAGTLEASSLISMDRRVQSVAGALGDLVARSDTTISAATLTDYFRAASGIMIPFPTDEVDQVVTQVEVRNDGTTRVVWSRQYIEGDYGVGTQHQVGAEFELPDAMIEIARGGHVIVAETSYSYLPLYGIVFDKRVNLYRENFFMPRFGGTITVN